MKNIKHVIRPQTIIKKLYLIFKFNYQIFIYYIL